MVSLSPDRGPTPSRSRRNRAMLTLALALTSAVAPPADPTEPPPAAMDEEDRWVLLRAREWMARVGLGDGSGWEGDVAAGLRDAAPLAATDPQIRELEPLLRSVASAAPRGIFADDAPAPASWTFAWLDFDGD